MHMINTDKLALFIRPDFWLRRRLGATSAGALGAVCFLTVRGDIGFSLGLWYFPGFVLGALFLWCCWSQWYLRTGTNLKIGFVVNADRSAKSDWSKTIENVTELFHDAAFRHDITFKLIPECMVGTKSKLDRLYSRYDFSMVVAIRQTEEPTQRHYKFEVKKIPPVDFKSVELAFSNLQRILQPRSHQLQASSFCRPEASTIFEGILFICAFLFFVRRQYREASVLLEYLDSQLESHCMRNENPRRQIRSLDLAARMAPSSHDLSQNDIDRDWLEPALISAKSALKYAPEEPAVFFQIARLEFFNGDEQEAKRQVEEAFKYESIFVPNTRVTAYIDKGFLALIDARWSEAYQAFRIVYRQTDHWLADWADLIKFADRMAELKYQGAAYIQGLYRALAGDCSRTSGYFEGAESWAAEDSSRELLGKLLEEVISRTNKNTGVGKKNQNLKKSRNGNQRRKSNRNSHKRRSQRRKR